MEARNIKLKAEKKAKKGIKKEIEIKKEVEECSTSTVAQPDKLIKAEPEKPSKTDVKDHGNSNKLPVIKILPGTSKSENGQKCLKRIAAAQSLGDPVFKKSKDAYSVAQDPEASEVFKSIFTTHSTAAQQDKAHWITYNPFYN